MNLGWMAWTLPGAIFFTAVAVALAVLTVAELVWPTRARRGFLPLVTTRGDRFFVSLLSAAFIHVLWLATTDVTVWWASLISLAAAVVLMRWG
jgi:predicted small integral membrane protein